MNCRIAAVFRPSKLLASSTTSLQLSKLGRVSTQRQLALSVFFASRRSQSTIAQTQEEAAPMSEKETKTISKETAAAADKPHQFQAGASTNRKEDEWKHREPYRIHDDDEDFKVKWRGSCHCGKIKYQLSRDKPLASKYCHCTTCQRLHGVSRNQTRRENSISAWRF